MAVSTVTKGNSSPMSMFLAHDAAGGGWFCSYGCIYLRQRWCFILGLCIFDEKHTLKLSLKCSVLIS